MLIKIKGVDNKMVLLIWYWNKKIVFSKNKSNLASKSDFEHWKCSIFAWLPFFLLSAASLTGTEFISYSHKFSFCQFLATQAWFAASMMPENECVCQSTWYLISKSLCDKRLTIKKFAREGDEIHTREACYTDQEGLLQDL